MTAKKSVLPVSKPRARKPADAAAQRQLSVAAASPAALMAELRVPILATRQTVAQGINSALVLLYGQIGQRIRTDILKAKRAKYGEQIVHAVSAKLTAEFGCGFTPRNLFNMVRFAETFPDPKTVRALNAILSWTPLRRIIYLDDPLQRDFYADNTAPRDASVGRRDALIANSPNDVWLYDQGSSRGIRLDGNAVQGRACLDGMHRVMVGRNEVEVGARADLLIQAGLNGTRRAS